VEPQVSNFFDEGVLIGCLLVRTGGFKVFCGDDCLGGFFADLLLYRTQTRRIQTGDVGIVGWSRFPDF
jgi:hypothetical protein